MRRSLFNKIVAMCEDNTCYFKCKRNAAGLMGFSGHQKISAVRRIFAYGIPADYTDEYLRVGEDTMLESVRRFCKVMMRVYGIARLMAENEQRGWPGMVGSIDCMHWT
jgi:hypothetical protein